MTAKNRGCEDHPKKSTVTVQEERFDRAGLEHPPVDFLAYKIAPDPRYVQHALEHDLPVIHNRLAQVSEVLEEIYQFADKVKEIDAAIASEMRKSVSWGKLMLRDASRRTDTLVRGLGIDAIPGSKHRPGWKRGGRTRADNIKGNHDMWQREAEKIWKINPSMNKTEVARRLELRLDVPFNTLRQRIHKPH